MLTDNVKFFVHSWLAALRSGNFSQTKSRLESGEGYCCLGVACMVLKQTNGIKLDYTHTDDDGHYTDAEILRGENLSAQSAVEVFFRQLGLGTNGEPIFSADYEDYNKAEIIHMPEDLQRDAGRIYHELASLNDTFNLNFDQIADFIEVTYGSEWGL